MSSIQTIFTTILPRKWAESMEKESREWVIRCQDCKYEQTVWELGGIRWKASNIPARRMKCKNCGRFSKHISYRQES